MARAIDAAKKAGPAASRVQSPATYPSSTPADWERNQAAARPSTTSDELTPPTKPVDKRPGYGTV
jgi:hypothetical protein